MALSLSVDHLTGYADGEVAESTEQKRGSLGYVDATSRDWTLVAYDVTEWCRQGPRKGQPERSLGRHAVMK